MTSGFGIEHFRPTPSVMADGTLDRPQFRTVGSGEILSILRRRLRIILFVVVTCTTLAAIYAFSLEKFYTAEAALVLERTDTRPFAAEIDLQRQVRDRSAADTEVDVIVSRLFIGRIVDSLNLVGDPNYNTYLRQPVSLIERLKGTVRDALDPVVSVLPKRVRSLLQTEAPALPKLPSASKQRDRAISTVISQLSVSRRGESLAVAVAVTTPDPDQSAAIANAVADTYVQASLEFKRDVRQAGRERARATSGAVAFLRERVSQPLLMTLREEEARLLRQRADLSATYGKDHPKILNVDAEISSVRSMIGDEIQRILLDLEEEAAKPSARVVSVAAVPTEPSFPKPKLIIVGAFTGSLVVAFLMAFMLEAADTRIRTGEQSSQLVRLSNLAYVPRISRRGGRRPNPAGYVKQKPQSGFAEAMRSLYLACRTLASKRTRHVVMLTSCLPEEGKTSIAVGLSVTAANDGRRVALVDLDLHRCGVGKLLNLEPSVKPFEQFLDDGGKVEEIVRKARDVNGLDVIAASSPPHNPSRLLNSDRLQHLIEELRTNYEIVIVDTPPVLVVDDANWLSSSVDAVILILKWGTTREGALWDAVTKLRLNQAPIVGTVINQVEPRVQAAHGYGSALNYWQQGKGYIVD